MIYKDSLKIELGAGRTIAHSGHVFPRNVITCGIGLTGYDARLLGGDDDHLGMMSILLDVKRSPNDLRAVEMTIDVEVRDVDLSAKYAATVEFVIFAALEPHGALVPGEPRPDLVVTGVEFNQAIQAYRSSEHMAIQHAMPDNGVPLVAGKPTCARVYVDFDVTSPHPIAPLTGTLTVIRGDERITLSPVLFASDDHGGINRPSPPPAATITATPDGIGARRDPDRTLNFLIPATFCVGSPLVQANVTLDGMPDHFVRMFQTEARFQETSPPSIHLVGMRYSGPQPLPGQSTFFPTATDCRNSMAFANRLFPMAAMTSSYDTLDVDYGPLGEAFVDNLLSDEDNDACDWMGSFLDALSDLRGDRQGVMVGFLPPGFPKGGGCGRRGVCVSRVGNGSVAAHEFGHALGFKHAACAPGECQEPPKNVDDSYPHYLPYPVGSVGEFGVEIDGAALHFRTPEHSRELLGYAHPRWITPYTYIRAFNQWAANYVAPSSSPLSFVATAPAKKEHLFLDIEITRARAVSLLPTFHFPIFPPGLTGPSTDFTVELSDDAGRVLKSAAILAETDDEDGCCGCGGAPMWPRHFRQPIPFDARATRISVYECDKLIHEEPVPPPPSVEVSATGHDDACSPHVILEWTAHASDGRQCAFQYLVQMETSDGSWAGLAPRSAKPFLVIEKTRLLDRSKTARLRVLASSGIATGRAEWEDFVTYTPCEPKKQIA